MKRFTVGSTYTTRSACDYDCIFSFTVVSRTEKSVIIVGDLINKPTRKKIYTYGTEESFLPYGSFSMAPSVSA